MAAPQPAQDGLQPALKFNTHQFIVLRMDNKRKINPLAMRLFDTKGQRLYCNAEERALFLAAAHNLRFSVFL